MNITKWNESSDPHELLTVLRTLNYPKAALCRLARQVIVRKHGEPVVVNLENISAYDESARFDYDYTTEYMWALSWNRSVEYHWTNGLMNPACADPIVSFNSLYRRCGANPSDSEGCDLIREDVGNPFDPPAVLTDWLTSDVLALAGQMRESRDFWAMPILADALQDAGCDSDDILTHCRQTNKPHNECCWVLNLLMSVKD